MSDTFKQLGIGAAIVVVTLIGNSIYEKYFSSRSNLLWADVDEFTLPAAYELPDGAQGGFSLLLSNSGGKPANNVEIFLNRQPFDLRVEPRLPYEVTENGTGSILRIASLGPGDEARVDLFGMSSFYALEMVRVEGDQVAESYIEEDQFRTGIWLPGWMGPVILFLFISQMIDSVKFFRRNANPVESDQTKT